MKLCPKCQANVEGLIHHCDCCGASLDTRKRAYSCFLYDFPSCLGFDSLAFGMIDEIEPFEAFKYSDLFDKIEFEIFCWPKTDTLDAKIRNRVYYSEKRKFARITLLVDSNEFIPATKAIKADLVADAIICGLNMWRERVMKKSRVDIIDIVTEADESLKRYKFNFLTQWDFIHKYR